MLQPSLAKFDDIVALHLIKSKHFVYQYCYIPVVLNVWTVRLVMTLVL